MHKGKDSLCTCIIITNCRIFDATLAQVIMATNRADTLDPALLRPGRLDRKIEFPLPDRRQKRLIFSTITGRMNLSDELDLEDYVARPDRISGADINAICQEVCACNDLLCSIHGCLSRSYFSSFASALWCIELLTMVLHFILGKQRCESCAMIAIIKVSCFAVQF